MVIKLAGNRLVGRARDGVRLPWWEPPRRGVDKRGRFLDVTVAVIDTLRHPVVADGEMHQAALRLRAPVAVGGHVNAAHRIGLVPLTGGVDTEGNVVQDGMRLVFHRVVSLNGSESAGDREAAADRDNRAAGTSGAGYSHPVSTAVCRAGPRSRSGCHGAARPAPDPSQT